ncbi:serine carboxypeptidase 24-like protein [Tanacetum coccineum]
MNSCTFTSAKYTPKCDDPINYAWSNKFGEIDQYSIYTPFCHRTSGNYTSRRFKNSLVRGRTSGYDPCVERNAEKYYNRPDVQHAMHANYTVILYKWTACSAVVDTDSVVPVTSKRFSLSHLDVIVNTQWYLWYIDGQVGGWSEVYNGLTFATVRGAGHEVPLLQPQRGFLLF